MSDKPYETIMLPVQVAAGTHCWKRGRNARICDHFGNDFGTPSCELNIGTPEVAPDGYRKPLRCIGLRVHKRSA